MLSVFIALATLATLWVAAVVALTVRRRTRSAAAKREPTQNAALRRRLLGNILDRLRK